MAEVFLNLWAVGQKKYTVSRPPFSFLKHYLYEGNHSPPDVWCRVVQTAGAQRIQGFFPARTKRNRSQRRKVCRWLRFLERLISIRAFIASRRHQSQFTVIHFKWTYKAFLKLTNFLTSVTSVLPRSAEKYHLASHSVVVPKMDERGAVDPEARPHSRGRSNHFRLQLEAT